MRPAALLLLPALLAACSDGGTAPSPDAFEFRVGLTYPTLPGRPFGLTVAPNGTVLVTQQDNNRLTRIARDDRAPRAVVLLPTDPGDVIATPDGSRIVVSAFISGQVHFVDAATLTLAGSVPLGPNAYRLALSGDGARVFVTTTGGKVFALGVTTRAVLDSVQLSGPLQGIARHPGGTLAVSSTDGAITLLDPATLDTLRSRAIPPGAQDIVFSPDGRELFVALESSVGVLVLDGTTLAPLDTISFTGALPVTPFGLALSPDGRTLLVTSAATGTLAAVDLPERTVRAVAELGGAPRRVAFSRDGGSAYVANEANRVDVIR